MYQGISAPRENFGKKTDLSGGHFPFLNRRSRPCGRQSVQVLEVQLAKRRGSGNSVSGARTAGTSPMLGVKECGVPVLLLTAREPACSRDQTINSDKEEGGVWVHFHFLGRVALLASFR